MLAAAVLRGAERLHDGSGSMSNRTVLVAAVALGILIGGPFAVADTKDPIREGVRNPVTGDADRETQIIARYAKPSVI
jgi:hypothetical protein